MRATAAALLTAFRAQNPNLVVLLDLETGSSPATVRLTLGTEPVTWNGSTYAVRPFEIGNEIQMQNQGEAARITIHVANADAYFQGLIAAGARFIRRKVTLRAFDSSRVAASPVENVSDVFYVDAFTFTQGDFVLELLPRFGLLDVVAPRGTLTRQEFPGLPRDIAGL